MCTFLLRQALVSRTAVAALLASFAVAQADFITPAFRGGTDTTYQRWEAFLTPTGPNPPDVADVNPNGTADLVELSGQSFVTSGGNIYSFAVATDFDVTVPDYNYGAGYVTDVVVQIRTQGTGIDLSSVLWNGISPDDSELLFEQLLGGFGGALQDWKFTWDDLPGNIAVNLLSFNAQGSSMSLDRLAIDTQATAVPEASTLMLVGVAACSLAVLRLRGRKS